MSEQITHFPSTTALGDARDSASPSAPTTLVPDIARAIAFQDDDDALEALIDHLPARDVTTFLWSAERIAKQARQAARFAESRIIADRLMGEGETWTAPDGQELMWATDRKRVCAACSKPTSDGCEHMEQLHAVLLAMPLESSVARNALRTAFKPSPMRAYLTQLNEVAKFSEEAAAEIRSFLKYIETPPHLRSVDPKDR